MNDDELPFSAAAERNRAPILEVLERVLPPHATVLEVASGSGQHAAHFAAAQPGWTWQPTEADASLLPALAARCAALATVGAPLRLDVLAQPWPAVLGRFDAVYCANLLHIAPWSTCAALMAGAAAHLVAGGALVIYGPFLEEGVPTSPGNRAFDAEHSRGRPPRSLSQCAGHRDGQSRRRTALFTAPYWGAPAEPEASVGPAN